jgi:hypothetical protein
LSRTGFFYPFSTLITPPQCGQLIVSFSGCPKSPVTGTSGTKTSYPLASISRFALMQGETVKTFGSFTKYEGCYYSNLRFIDYLIY